MNTMCEVCGQAFKIEKEPVHKTKDFGITLHIYHSVEKVTCKCGTEIHIQNHEGLISAAALIRVGMKEKLNGKEIRFLRKAVEMSAKEFADFVTVTPETLSRWENDKQPISPAAEKLLRVFAAIKLSDKAPAVDIDLNKLADMKINGFSNPDQDIPISLMLVRYKKENQKPEDLYTEKEAA